MLFIYFYKRILKVNILKKIVVFCGSSLGFNPIYKKAAVTLGNYFVENKKLETYLYDSHDLTPGFFLKYNELHNKYKVDIKDNIYLKINKLLHGYKKDKDKAVISMTIFLIEKFFFILIKNNVKKIDMLINLKLSIVKKINDFIIYNLNISTVLHSIELKLRNVR